MATYIAREIVKEPMPDPEHALPSLEALQQKIDKAKGPLKKESTRERNSDMSLVMRFSVELLTGVGVGCAVGYMLDRWFGTLPLFFIICLFLGMGGGMLNVIRSGRMIDAKADAEQNEGLES